METYFPMKCHETFSETLITTCKTTRHYNPEGLHRRLDCRKNYINYILHWGGGVQGGVKRSSMIASPSQISTSPSSGGPCYNKRGTDVRKWAE
jgi:hypothetical protein